MEWPYDTIRKEEGQAKKEPAFHAALPMWHLCGFIEVLHQRKYLLRVAFEGDARHMTSERIKGKADTFVTAAVDGVAEECGNSLRIHAGQSFPIVLLC